MKLSRKGMAAIAVVLLIGGFFYWKTSSQNGDQPRFRALTVERGPISVTVLSTGNVTPQNRLEIKPPIAGRIERILVTEGQRVGKDQTIAWMSSTERAALLDAARARGGAELAQWEELYKPTPLIAPLSGMIIARNIEPGQTVTASDAVLVMADRLIVKAQVDETDIGQIHIGQTADLVLDAYPKMVIPARVDHIAYEAQTVNNVTIYEVDVLPEKVPTEMRSGMTANATFHVASKPSVLLLPTEALRTQDGDNRVLLAPPAGSSDRPHSQSVETGLNNGKMVEITSGLNEGDHVLIPVVRIRRSTGSSGSPFTPGGGRRSQ